MSPLSSPNFRGPAGSTSGPFSPYTADAVRVEQEQRRRAQDPGVTWDASAAVKGSRAPSWTKEIHEQPTAVADALRGRTSAVSSNLTNASTRPRPARSVTTRSSSSPAAATYAGHVAKYAIEHWCPVEVELATVPYQGLIRRLTVAISSPRPWTPSESPCATYREQGSKVLAIVNTPGSTIAKPTPSSIPCRPRGGRGLHPRPLAQITACYLLGLYSGPAARATSGPMRPEYLTIWEAMPERIQHVLTARRPACATWAPSWRTSPPSCS